MSAGKGDLPRPVRGEVYRKNYEAIFLKKSIASFTKMHQDSPQITKPSTPALTTDDGHEPGN